MKINEKLLLDEEQAKIIKQKGIRKVTTLESKIYQGENPEFLTNIELYNEKGNIISSEGLVYKNTYVYNDKDQLILEYNDSKISNYNTVKSYTYEDDRLVLECVNGTKYKEYHEDGSITLDNKSRLYSEYDENNRLIKETYIRKSGRESITNYEYKDKLVKISTDNKYITEYEYDEEQRLISKRKINGYIDKLIYEINYEYKGNSIFKIYSMNTTKTECVFDNDGLLLQEFVREKDGTIVSFTVYSYE